MTSALSPTSARACPITDVYQSKVTMQPFTFQLLTTLFITVSLPFVYASLKHG